MEDRKTTDRKNPAFSLKDNVLGAIRAKGVKMRPKWQFILRAALAISGIAIAFLFGVYLVSLIVFVLRLSGAWFAPSYGMRGLHAFLVAVPWAVVILSLVFIGVLELLVSHFSFAYRRPLFYSVLGVVALVVVSGLLVARTGFHRGLMVQARNGRLPFAGMMYRTFDAVRPDGLFRGVVIGPQDAGFTMTDPDGAAVAVFVDEGTRMPPGWRPVEGEYVAVFGNRTDDGISAFGIQSLDDLDDIPRPRFGPGARLRMPPR